MEKTASCSDAPISAVIAELVTPYTRPDTQDLDEARRVAREVLAKFASGPCVCNDTGAVAVDRGFDACPYGCEGFNGVVDATCTSCSGQVPA